MCANGPASRSGSRLPGCVRRRPGRSAGRAAQHRHHLHVGVVARDQVVDDARHLLALGGRGGTLPTSTPRRVRVAEPLPGRVQEREVGARPGLRLAALQQPHLVGIEPGRTSAQVRRHRPQVADEVGRVDQRPGPTEGVDQLVVLGERATYQVLGDVGVVGVALVLVDEDREQLLPDLVAALVVRGPGLERLERLGPVVRAEPDVGPRGRDLHALGRRLLVEPDRRLDRRHHVGGRLEPGHLGVGFVRRRGPFGQEVAQGAGLHTLLAEAGQYVGDVGQVGLVRTDEEHASAALAEARVGVEQVRRTVQRDDGLARCPDRRRRPGCRAIPRG